MIVLGLTGSIGMGKSTTAGFFRTHGCPVLDSDATVHALYGPGGAAVAPIEAAFPGVTTEAGVDRVALAGKVLGKAEEIARLEAIVHPLVAEVQTAFLARHRQAGAPFVLLDIPLLFEIGRDATLDLVAVVTAPAEIQRARVLARPGMTEEKFAAILARQMPDAEKRRRAHAIIDTGRGLAPAEAQVVDLVRMMRFMAG